MADAKLPFISYAQNREDVVLWRALNSVTEGIYIDVGAAHPVWESVTKAFYDRGWHGINIEPNPHFHEILERERPRDINILALAGVESGVKELYIVGQSGLSTAAEESRKLLDEHGHVVTSRITSKVVCIDEVLRKHRLGEIHFLKVDAEGMEIDALRGCALNVNRPKIIIVESTLPETNVRRNDGLRDLLQSKDYQFTLFDGLNDYFVARECASLADAVSLPANPVDHFQTSIEVDLQSRLDHVANSKPVTTQVGTRNALSKTLVHRMCTLAQNPWRKLSTDDVKWAYLLFLRRHPENDEVILHHLSACKDVKSLVEAIMESEEYLSRAPNYVGGRTPPSADLHYFFHIYKTGGMSVHQYLSESVPEGELLPGFHVDDLLQTATRGPFRYLSGHFADLPLKYESHHLKMATLLRNPVERGLSHYKHLMRTPNPEFPSDELHASLTQFLSGRFASLVFGNVQAYCLAQLSPASKKFLHGMGDIKATRGELLELAMDGLSQIELVGLTEDMERFLDKLSVAWLLPPPSKSYRTNTSLTDDICPSANDLKTINELCAIDIQLYEHVVSTRK